jgi:hypothetical protein
MKRFQCYFAPKWCVPEQEAWVFRSLDNACLELCVPWRMRPLANASLTNVPWPFAIELCWDSLGKTVEAKLSLHYTNVLCQVSLGQDKVVSLLPPTSIESGCRVETHWSRTHHPWDALSKKQNIRDFFVGYTMVGDTLSHNTEKSLIVRFPAYF